MKAIDPFKKEIDENRICGFVGSQLQAIYPGWDWYVDCKLESGVVTIRNLTLNGDWGYAIPLNVVLTETDPRVVRLAGGEILERHYQAATARKSNIIDRNFDGSAVGDLDG
jgi:hypothetical protein